MISYQNEGRLRMKKLSAKESSPEGEDNKNKQRHRIVSQITSKRLKYKSCP
jgi:hypothetical protein